MLIPRLTLALAMSVIPASRAHAESACVGKVVSYIFDLVCDFSLSLRLLRLRLKV